MHNKNSAMCSCPKSLALRSSLKGTATGIGVGNIFRCHALEKAKNNHYPQKQEFLLLS